MTTGHLQLAIELAVGVEPITGELRDGDLEPRRFCGWLELAEVIERARNATDPTSDRESTRHEP